MYRNEFVLSGFNISPFPFRITQAAHVDMSLLAPFCLHIIMVPGKGSLPVAFLGIMASVS